MQLSTLLLFLLVATAVLAVTARRVRPQNKSGRDRGGNDGSRQKLTAKRRRLTEPECYTGNGEDYRGMMNRTNKGTPCINWADTEANQQSYPGKGLGDHNYCRNPDSDQRPWCYVARGKFGFCPVPMCSTTTPSPPSTTTAAAIVLECYTGNGEDYRGMMNRTNKGTSCINWADTEANQQSYPGKGLGNHNYCRNPDSDRRPWCYVARGKFGFCPVPRCSTTTPSPPSTTSASVTGPECYTGNGEDYRGMMNRTNKGTSCINWADTEVNQQSHPGKGLGDHNYCRNPDSDQRPWCYVARGKFGFCPVPRCSTTTSSPPSTASAAEQECYDGNGEDYRGMMDHTDDGTVCINWANTEVNQQSHPGKGLGDHNYCRNPDSDQRPWCYVTSRRFGFCPVPRCSTTTSSPPSTVSAAVIEQECYTGNGEDYRGMMDHTEQGTPCINWASTEVNQQSHPGKGLGDHNYCRNPDSDQRPWCYVARGKFGFCPVPVCFTTTPSISSATSATGEAKCGLRPFESLHRRKRQAVNNNNLTGSVTLEPPHHPHYHKIVGGDLAQHGMYPWQVRVQKIYNVYPNGDMLVDHWCGATVINQFWILSAAHCFTNLPMSRVLVKVGDHGEVEDHGEQKFRLEKLIMHPDYRRRSHDNDIALLKVKSSGGHGIKFNNYVQPACLPTSSTPYTPGTVCLISGWGETGSGSAENLRAAEVPLLSRSTCKDIYRSGLTTNMLCAGYRRGGVDTCQGDSGGPLVCKIDGAYTLMGITSWGFGCAEENYPGVYAITKQYLTWIEDIIRRDAVGS